MINWKKYVTIIAITFSAILIFVLLFISPIAKYVIEKNSVAWTGRQIKIEKLRINLLTGTLSIVDLAIQEKNNQSDFVRCKEFNTSINIFKLINGSYEIQQFKINGLYISVTKTGNRFNFDDIIEHFASDLKEKNKPSNEPIKYWLRNIQLENCVIRFENNDFKNPVEVQKFNYKCPLIAWNESNIKSNFNFAIASGGTFLGDFDYDLKSQKYQMKMDAKAFNLSLLYPFVLQYIRVSIFEGFLDANFSLKGNANNSSNIIAAGDIKISKINLADSLSNSLFRMGELKFGIDSLNLLTNYYDFNKFYCEKLYLKYESYDSINTNWSRLMQAAENTGVNYVDTTVVSNPFVYMQEFFGDMVKNYLVSSYNADSVNLRNAEIDYADYSMPEKFEMNLDQMNLSIGNLNTNKERLQFNYDTRINKVAKANTILSVNPRNYKDMELTYEIYKLPVNSFNPYMIFEHGWPFKKGDINYSGTIFIENGNLLSKNHFQVMDPKVGAKSNPRPMYDMPVKLAVAILKDVKGNIDFDIPVKGNINDPKFRVGKIILKILGNLVVKAVSAPFNLLARAIGGKPEDEVREISFSYSKSTFNDGEYKSMSKLSQSLKVKTDLNLLFTQLYDESDELDLIAIQETKKMFAISKQALNPNDTSVNRILFVIDSISVSDTAFVSYINNQIQANNLIMSPQEKCRKIIGLVILKEKQQLLVSLRNKNLQDYFMSQEINPSRISFKDVVTHDLNPGEEPKYIYEITLPEENDSPTVKR